MSDSRRQLLQKRRSSLVLEGCPITDREKDEAHSTEVLFRWNAMWQNNVVTATQLPTDDHSEVRCIVDQMKSLRHPNVLQFWGVVDSVEVGVHIVTEHLKEDLNQLLKRLPNLSFPNRVNGLKQLANALSYLHSREISHGNLTSQSIFATDEGRVLKLAYFGLARFSQKQAKSAACLDDVRSYGLILQIMLCGNEDLTKFQEIMKKYQKTHKGVADELTSLCRKCLEKNPVRRPNAGEVAQQAPTVKSDDSETSIELQRKDASNAAQAQAAEQISSEMSASKSKDDAEMTTIREKAKTLQEEKKKLESQLVANKNLFEKAKEDSCNELEKLKKEKMSLKQDLKTIEEGNKQTILQHRKTIEEKMAAERKCEELENLVEQLKTYNRNQREGLTEAETKLESCKKSIVAKDTAFQQQKTLLEETITRLRTAIESLSGIQSKASSTLSEIAREQPSLTKDTDQEVGKGSGKKPQQEMQSTKLYVCQTCSTPLVDTSLVVHLRVRMTTSVSILSDYKKTSKAVKAMLENAMKSYGRPGFSPSVLSRGDFKKAHLTPDSTCIFVIPVLERYIICDPEDPSTGFYREMSSLKTNQIIVIVCCDDEPQPNSNYSVKLSRLWGGSSRQGRLKELAEIGRFYSVQESKGFRPWQVTSLAAALGFLPKGRQQTDLKKK